MQGSPLDQDTSSYWRKLLKMDAPAGSGLINKTDSFLKIFRPPFNFFIRRFSQRYFSLGCEGCGQLPPPPYIIASNHSSIFDFPAILFCLPPEHQGKIVAMYKGFYDKNPVTRFFIKLFVKSIPVDLEKKPWEALSSAAMILKSGNSIYIAPEGTRSKGGEVLPFKVGVGTLAVETKCPVVPVFIKGADKALPRGSFFPKRAPIKVFFGKPVDSSIFFDKKKDAAAYDVYKEMTETIRQKILELSAL